MNISPTTVYPDVDAAAHVWANTATLVDEDADSWVLRIISKYCNQTLDILNDDTLSGPYKVGYAKANVKSIQRIIEISKG